jgi:hypothetical protein
MLTLYGVRAADGQILIRNAYRSVDPCIREGALVTGLLGDLRMSLYRATPGNPRQMRRRRPLSNDNRTPPPTGLRLHPV